MVCSHCPTPRLRPRLIEMGCLKLSRDLHTVQRQTPTRIPIGLCATVIYQCLCLCLCRYLYLSRHLCLSRCWAVWTDHIWLYFKYYYQDTGGACAYHWSDVEDTCLSRDNTSFFHCFLSFLLPGNYPDFDQTLCHRFCSFCAISAFYWVSVFGILKPHFCDTVIESSTLNSAMET